MGWGIVLCIRENLRTCIYMNLDSSSQNLAKDRDSHDGSSDYNNLHNTYSVPFWYNQVKNTPKNHRVSVGIYQHWRGKPTMRYEYAVSLPSVNRWIILF